VSSGVTNVEVPNVVTVPADDAAKQLKDLGFQVGYKYGNDPNSPDGIVLAQSIPGGTKKPKGTTVTLTVNNPQEPTPPPSQPTDTPTETPSSPGITIGG